MSLVKAISIIVTVIVFVAVAILGMSWVLQMLWNWIASGVFGLPELSFFQAFGLYLLLWFLGSFFKSTVTTKKED